MPKKISKGVKAKPADSKAEAARNAKINALVASGMDHEEAVNKVNRG